MPEGILNAIASSERKTGKSAKDAKRIAYATANTRGYMHGSKETAAGAAAEAKYERDHGRGRRKRSGMKGADVLAALGR